MPNEKVDLSPQISRRTYLVVLLAFVASGAAGLVYEVVWFRSLTYVFGATQLAVSTVLAAFMGGLALGSFALGRAADRMRHPLRVYAGLEACIAISGVSVPWLLRAVEPIGHQLFGEIPFAISAFVRFFCAAAVLLVPTTLMGATVPVMSRYLVRQKEAVGLNVGGLYAANTFGAVAGAFLAGFVFIALWGIHHTLWIAGTLNLIAAILAMMLARREPPLTQTTPAPVKPLPAQTSPAAAKTVLWTYGLSGFVALCYQVVWTRGMLFSAEGTTYTFTAILSLFLAGLAIGSAAVTRWVDRIRQPLHVYAGLLLALGVTGGLSAMVLFDYSIKIAPLNLHGIPADSTQYFVLSMVNRFAATFAVVGAPTLVMGMAFPVAVRLAVDDTQRIGGGVGRLYAFNTVGAILGSFAAGFVLLPLLGIARAFLLLSAISLLSAIAVTCAATRSPRARAATTSVALVALVAFAFDLAPASRITFQRILTEDLPYQILAWEEGPMDTVSVTENTIGTRKLFVDNVPVAGTDRIILTDQKSLAHLPVLFAKNPTSALTVGFGSGGASYSYLLYPELTRVRAVEISTTVLRPAIQRPLAASNHGLIDKLSELAPRYGIIGDDARSYLRFTTDRYDSIATDCTDLRYKSNANLYDLEYFQFCRERITDDGMVVVWMPLGSISEDVFLIALNTFAQVFGEQTHVWYHNNDMIHYILLVGTKRAMQIDYRLAAQRLSRPEIHADLAEVGLADIDKMLAGYVTGGKPLLRTLAGRRLNTEDHPIIEFEAARAIAPPRQLWANLHALYKDRQSVLSLIDAATLTPESRERIDRMERAAPTIARGLELMHVQVDLYAAAKQFADARKIAPDDPSLDSLEMFELQKRMLQADPTDAGLAYSLGRGDLGRAQFGPDNLRKARLETAARFFQHAAQKSVPPPSHPNESDWGHAVRWLAWCLSEMGLTAESANVLSEARRVAPALSDKPPPFDEK